LSTEYSTASRMTLPKVTAKKDPPRVNPGADAAEHERENDEDESIIRDEDEDESIICDKKTQRG